MRAIAAVRLALQILSAVVLTLTCSAGLALAQAGASTGLMGRITDSSGAVVPGVTVRLTHVDTGRERVVTTGVNGD